AFDPVLKNCSTPLCRKLLIILCSVYLYYTYVNGPGDPHLGRASVARCSCVLAGEESEGGCGLSRRCTCGNRAADGRSVAETTMRASEVVVLEPWEQVLIPFF